MQKIEEVGLSDRKGHRPNELSGGQQRRVAIARALVNDPLIIMADEPTGNLDSKSKEEIITVIKSLNQKGKTIIMVTHEKEAAAHARRVITMRDGKIISDEKTQTAVGREGCATAGQADEILDIVLSKAEKTSRGSNLLIVCVRQGSPWCRTRCVHSCLYSAY